MSNEYGIKAHIQYSIHKDDYELWILDNRHDGRYFATIVDGYLLFAKQIDYRPQTATMVLNGEVGRAIAKALKDLNMQPIESSKLEGLYEAQTKHLEDMRELVFKK
jgi:hypothetical protein